MNIGDLFPAILTLGVAGFGGAIILTLLTQLRATQTANNADANFTDAVSSAMLGIDDWFPVFVTVIAGAIAIGVVVFFGRVASRS